MKSRRNTLNRSILITAVVALAILPVLAGDTYVAQVFQRADDVDSAYEKLSAGIASRSTAHESDAPEPILPLIVTYNRPPQASDIEKMTEIGAEVTAVLRGKSGTGP